MIYFYVCNNNLFFWLLFSKNTFFIDYTIQIPYTQEMIYIWNIVWLDRHIERMKNILQKDIFVVGWSVRDVLLGMADDPTDVDVTCAIHPDEVFSALQRYVQDNQSESVGLFRTEKFGTATVIVQDDTIKYTYEITPFREEGGYTDRRHPTEVVWSDSLLADAGRRDFTINALYYTSVKNTNVKNTQDTDLAPKIAPLGATFQVDTEQLIGQLTKQGWSYIPWVELLIVQDTKLIETLFPQGVFSQEAYTTWAEMMQIPYAAQTNTMRFLLDPTTGMQDALAQKVRTVGYPDKRFNEDALRILRALRFVNIWNQKLPWAKFDFHKDTWNSMKKNYHLVQYLAKERIHDELIKVFSANNPFGYVALLDEMNLLQYIFPALARCKYNDQPIRYHPFDTYSHILLTLWHLQQLNTNYLVKLWMLYHDVGKPDQYYYYAQCKTKEDIEALHGSWANHVVCGPEFAEKDFAALAFSRKEIEEISWYVAQHMRPGQILDARIENQRKKMRLLYSEFWFDRMKNLLDICKADRLGQYNPLQSAEIESVQSLYDMLTELRDTEWQFTKKELAISGNDIMNEFALQPGPQLGELIEKAFQRVVHDSASRNKTSTILSYIKGLL